MITLDTLEYFVTTSSFCALLAAIYKFSLRKDTIEKHHIFLVNILEFLGGGRLTISVQRTLKKLILLFNNFYGHPVAGTKKHFRRYLTRTSLKSSMVVSFTYLTLPLLLSVQLFIYYVFFIASPLTSLKMGGWLIVIISTVITLLFCFTIKNVWLNRLVGTTEADTRTLFNTILYYSLTSSAFFTLSFSIPLILFIKRNQLGFIFDTALYLPCLGLTIILNIFSVIYFLRSLVKSIQIHDVLSPIAIAGIITGFWSLLTLFMALIFMAIFAAIAVVAVLFYENYMGGDIGLSEGKVMLLTATTLMPIISSYKLWFELRNNKNISRGALIHICTIQLMFLILGVIPFNEFSQTILGETMEVQSIQSINFFIINSFIFGLTISLILFIPIMANSIPDTLSVAFTRYCLHKIYTKFNIAIAVWYLLLDIAFAFICIFLSILIVCIGIELIEYLLLILQHDFLLKNHVARILNEVQIVKAILSGGVSSDHGQEMMLLYWGVILSFSLTGALPTIFNGLVIVLSVLLNVIIKLSLYIHDLLTEEDESGSPIGKWRSSVIVGSILGMIISFGVVLVK